MLLVGPVSFISMFFICKQNYRSVSNRDFRLPSMDSPLIRGRLPLRGEFDGALLTIGTSMGALLGVACVRHSLSFEGLAGVLWGTGNILGIRLFISREKKRKKLKTNEQTA